MASSTEGIFTKQSILKIVLISITILLWMYFYISSNVSLNTLIVFNIPSIINTFFTTNFLLFLILFPLTTAVIIGLSTHKNNWINILHISIGIVIGFVLSFLIFRLSKFVLIFGLLYLLSHIVLSILSYSKFKSTISKKRIFSLASYGTSKISILLTICLFILILLIILPHQQEYARNMEVGVVNMFIGQDISKWMGSSYEIGKASTNASLDFIMSTEQYKQLKEVQDKRADNFINFIGDFKKELSKKTTPEDIQEAFPNLDNETIKNKVFEAIHSIPLMVIVENYFAFIFAIILASIAQIYFAIGFGLLGLLYVFIFYKLFTNNTKKSEDEKDINYE